MLIVQYLESFALKYLPPPIRARIARANSENVAIMRGMIWVATFLFAAKIIGACKEILVAYRYGANAVVDGYLFVFNLAQWPASVFSSVVALVLIPYLVKLQNDDPKEAVALHNALIPATFALGVGVTACFSIGILWLIEQDVAGLTIQSRKVALVALPWLAPIITFSFVASIFSNWLMSQRRHSNSLLEATPAALIIVCLLLWPVPDGQLWTAQPLVVGTLIGFGVQLVLLGKLSGHRCHFTGPRALTNHWPSLKRAFGVVLLSQALMTSSEILDQFVAVRMGEGVLATYAYAQRVMSLALGLTAVVIGRAMLPVFSAAQGAHQRFLLAKRWAWRFALLGLFGTLILAVSAKWIITALFERGAFTVSDTAIVSETLRILGLQLPFYLSGIVLVQWIGAVRQTAWLLIAATVALLTKLLSVALWFNLGAAGLAAATVMMYAATTLVIYIGASQTFKRHK